MTEYLIAFLAGGTVTTLVLFFELSGLPTLSRVAAFFPIITWLSYLFIGRTAGGAEIVSEHAYFVMFGTLVAWLPYIFIIYYFSPRIGVTRAIFLAIAVFFVLAFAFAWVYNRSH